MLLLLALVWAQVAIAAHQFEHAGTGIEDVCRVCVQLERHGDAPPVVGIVERVLPATAAVVAEPPIHSADRPSPTSRPRDPPSA